MRFKRGRSAVAAGVLAGALLFTSAPPAAADDVRDQQWMMDVFAFEDTWQHSQGEGVTVGVVDSGADASHPDLAGNVLKGKDFTGGGDAQKDLDGHGTAMASLIAAHGHGPGNESGMMGVAPKAKVLPIRVFQKRTDKTLDEEWAKGVKYAVDHGAKVVNLSLGDHSNGPSYEAREAIAYAHAHDVVVVAGAGNDPTSLIYPAGIRGVVAVGGVDKNAERWVGSPSSTKAKQLTLMAPADKVLVADPNRPEGYEFTEGTSDASAFVSGVAALVRAKYPDLTAGQVINRLIKSASFLGHKGLKAPDEDYGYGIVRPRQAVTMDIPAGPKEGPLGLVKAPPPRDPNPGREGELDGSSSAYTMLFVGGGIAGAVIIAAIVVLAVLSRRRNRRGGPGGGPSPGLVPPMPGQAQGSVLPMPGQPQGSVPPPMPGQPQWSMPPAPGQVPQGPPNYGQYPPSQGH
ncbi:type VII secretion-associated serine protease mycosin [Streptomyces sp. NPDC002851]